MRSWIQSWEILGTNRQIPSVQGWLLNISSLQGLWEDVSSVYKLQYILSKINCEMINLVVGGPSSVRGQIRVGPYSLCYKILHPWDV